MYFFFFLQTNRERRAHLTSNILSTSYLTQESDDELKVKIGKVNPINDYVREPADGKHRRRNEYICRCVRGLKAVILCLYRQVQVLEIDFSTFSILFPKF